MKINVAVFFGCVSVEHEVSIISGVQAMQNMNRDKYNIIPIYVTKEGETVTGEALFDIESYKDIPSLMQKVKRVTLYRNNNRVVMKPTDGLFGRKETIIDLAFPVVHGTNCEDGSLAGWFEFLGLPYVGCNVLSSAIGMDKAVFKSVLKTAGIPVLPCVTLYSHEYNSNAENIEQALAEKIGYPMIIKPINLGSSVGITKVSSADKLRESLTLAFRFSDCILAEHAIESLKEVNCSVVGDHKDCEASVCEAPIMNDEILSYEDKYIGGNKAKNGSKGMASLSRKIPADIPDETAEKIRDLAVRTFRALNCSGVVRIDFMIDQHDNTVFVNEINTIPGSLAFYLWEATGMPYQKLIDKMIDTAYRRKRAKDNLMFTIKTNILSGVSKFGSKGSKGGCK